MEIELATLLRATWIAVILPILIALVPSPKPKKLHNLVLTFAKRGMTMQLSSKKFTVPQKFFCHFYSLGVLWMTLLLVATWIYAYRMTPTGTEPFQFSSITSQLTGGSHNFLLHRSHSMEKEDVYRIWLSVFLLLLMEAQLLRRFFETIMYLNTVLQLGCTFSVISLAYCKGENFFLQFSFLKYRLYRFYLLSGCHFHLLFLWSFYSFVNGSLCIGLNCIFFLFGGLFIALLVVRKLVLCSLVMLCLVL